MKAKVIIAIIAMLVLVQTNTNAQRQKQKQKVTQPQLTVEDARILIAEYKFDEAQNVLETIISQSRKKKQPTDEAESLQTLVMKGMNMLAATEKITIIDSVVTDKAQFLKAFNFSSEMGKVKTFNEQFNSTDPKTSDCIAYVNELGNKTIFASVDENGEHSLYSSNAIDGDWTKAQKIVGLEDYPDTNYPFLMSDGTTLYFASKGANSLGGYDIFVTREASEEGSYLKPENIGMPYNSMANDYMMVIDDFSQLGWFATDRNQPDDKVCIYIFVPNEYRVAYNDSTPADVIRRQAMIESIRQTWTDADALRLGRQRLMMLTTSDKKRKKIKDFELVIDDLTTYTNFNDFRSGEAQALMLQYLAAKKDYETMKKRLDAERTRYSKQMTIQNKTDEILKLEKECEEFETNEYNVIKNIRNTEIKHINGIK